MSALRDAVRDGLPRLLTLVDRAPWSPTRGLADRSFWHYRTDKDYPSATYAQIAWPLALLATRPELGVAERQRPELARLALDAARWWGRAARARGGALDEWFHNERSHVATAFTSFAVAEAMHALGAEERDITEGLVAAAGWLVDNHDLEVANHAAGAVAALASIDALLGRFGDDCDRQRRALLGRQDEAGWLPEYGGHDPGYGTVSLAFLGHAERRRPGADGDAHLTRLVAATAPFAHPDGSFGGVQGRRATRYAWLQGFALHAEGDPLAAATLGRLAAGLERGSLARPADFDDRYFCFFAFPDAVATLALLDGGDPPPAPSRPAPLSEGPELFVRAGGRLRVVVGAAVGGATAVWLADAPGTLLYDDAGYAGKLADGTPVSSWRHRSNAQIEPGTIRCQTAFSRCSRESPVARHPVAFRLFNRTLGVLPAASRWVASLGKRRYTTALAPAPLHLARSVRLETDRLTIIDRLTGSRPLALHRVAGFAPVHVPSAPLWLPSFTPLLPGDGPDLAATWQTGAGSREITTTLALDGDAAVLRVESGGDLLAESSAAMVGP